MEVALKMNETDTKALAEIIRKYGTVTVLQEIANAFLNRHHGSSAEKDMTVVAGITALAAKVAR